jgi:hypothetical protein
MKADGAFLLLSLTTRALMFGRIAGKATAKS